MEDYVDNYFAYVGKALTKVHTESGDSIRQAARFIANALMTNKDFLLFGSGHSALIAQEAVGRAGGLAPAILVEDITEHGDAERLEGMAALILGRYRLERRSVIVIISNSGINAVPVEMAQICLKAGMNVIAITSVAHSQQAPARHSSGKKLYEIASLVIDTHVPPGDVGIALPESTLQTGALSTLVGVSVVNALTVQVAAAMLRQGIAPPLWKSSNLPGGDEHNVRLAARYRDRVVRYQIPSLMAPAPGEGEDGD